MADLSAQLQFTKRLARYMMPASWKRTKASVTALSVVHRESVPETSPRYYQVFSTAYIFYFHIVLSRPRRAPGTSFVLGHASRPV